MLFLFRNNQFLTILPLALYVGLTHVGALTGIVDMPARQVADEGVLYRAWFGWAGNAPFWSAAGAALLVLVQAILVNAIADVFRLMSERNWLPGLFYVLAASCLPDYLFLSPPLVAATFLPIVLRRIFRSYQQPKATALILDAALWITAASLFYPPALYLLLAVFAGLSIMRSFTFRERMVALTGLLIVLFLAWLWYFWTDRGWEFWQIQFGNVAGLYRFGLTLDLKTAVQAALLSAMLLLTILNYGTIMFRNLIQTQKIFSVLYWFLFTAGLSVLLPGHPHVTHFLLLAPALAIFWGVSFSAWRNRFWPELIHLCLLGAALFVQFIPKLEVTGWL